MGGWRGVGNGELDERERDVGMYATYRQRVKRVREKRGSEQERARKRETEREREEGKEGERGRKREGEIHGRARSFRRRYNIAYANSLWT